MVQTEVGRYWSKRKDGSFATLRSFKTKEGCQKEVSKMRPTCKSHTDDKSRKRASAVRRKRAAGNTGPKPTNVKTRLQKHKKNMSMGGMV